MGRLARFRCVAVCLVAFVALASTVTSPAAAGPVPEPHLALNCTFTARYPVVILRDGPGRIFARLGFLRAGATLHVVNQAAGDDGFVWWQSDDDQWVRSDLGTSDCPSTCGNGVCEYGETIATCSRDCAANKLLTSTGSGCKVTDSQACYESVDCYPNCGVCRSWLNGFGCVTCQCSGSNSAPIGNTATVATGSGCTYSSCEACIAAFPCTGGTCTQTQCNLNTFGCPVCETAP